MRKSGKVLRSLQLISTSLVLVATADIAMAQQSEPLQEVKIEASRPVTNVAPAYPGGARVEIIQLSRPVSFKDLDLTKTADAAKLEQRIGETAKAACKQLDEMYPLTASPGGSCVKDATDSAMVKAKAAIAAATRLASK